MFPTSSSSKETKMSGLRTVSSVNDALVEVAAFAQAMPATPAWGLDGFDVVARLRVLLANPELIDQRGLNACAPAVFYRLWLERDPVAAARFTCKLLKDGSAPIGSLVVAPSWKLLGQRYAQLRTVTDAAHPGATPECTDWMLLSALRDSENIWFDYAGEPYTAGDAVAGITLPATLASWLSATGLYNSVENSTNLVLSADLNQFLMQNPEPGLDILLFVNTPAIYDMTATIPANVPDGSWVSVPNHYVHLQSMPYVDDIQRWVHLDVWSWARTWAGWQGSERFRTNYFGYIRASM
ncbi:hypothetical protein [Polymorphospora sp. NPDC050346]|uniref:hypothetical protein n=1 Tax=Polymorphospora sp. NPDC050346 TaxID=3155780 RepID=UPI0033D235C2